MKSDRTCRKKKQTQHHIEFCDNHPVPVRICLAIPKQLISAKYAVILTMWQFQFVRILGYFRQCTFVEYGFQILRFPEIKPNFSLEQRRLER